MLHDILSLRAPRPYLTSYSRADIATFLQAIYWRVPALQQPRHTPLRILSLASRQNPVYLTITSERTLVSAQPVPAKRDGLAVAATVLGALGIVFALAFPARFQLPFILEFYLKVYLTIFLGIVAEPATLAAILLAAFGLPSLLIATVSLWRIKRSRGELSGKAWASAGAACGAILTLCSALLLIEPVSTRFEIKHALALLDSVRGQESDWNYGDIVHEANSLLGRISLKEGNVVDAKRYLLEAGKTPGSPSLNSFGPDLSLANELLQRGEREAVLEYLELCAKFWDGGQGHLENWIALLKQGKTPHLLTGAALEKAGVLEMVPTTSSAPPSPAAAPGTFYEVNTDRSGSDYSKLDLEGSHPRLCREACEKDPKCKAWTYVMPNVDRNPRPLCRLQSAVQPPLYSLSSISGVKQATPSTAIPAPQASATADFLATNFNVSGLATESTGRFLGSSTSGRCPIAYDAQAYIRSEGSRSRVSYRFLYSDGYVSRTRTTTFNNPGFAEKVITSRIFGNSFAGWVVVQILEPDRFQSAPSPVEINCQDAKWSELRFDVTPAVLEAWRFEEVRAYGPEGTAARRPEPGRTWLALLIEVAAQSTRAGLTSGEMAVVDEAGARHTAVAIAGFESDGIRPKFLFLEEAFGVPLVSPWSHSYEGGQRSGNHYHDSNRRELFSIARDGLVKFPPGPARLFLLFAPPADTGRLELRFAKHVQAVPGAVPAPSFKEEGEVRIARSTQACNAGDAEACTTIGRFYKIAWGVPKDPARAAALFQKACDGGTPDGCWELGVMYERGTDIPKDLARAAVLFQKACDGGDRVGCWNLGVMYEHGTGVPKDLGRTAALYKQACDAGHEKGCSQLGYMHEHGQGVPKDEARAAGLYKQACDAGNAWSCGTLGYLYLEGRGVRKDQALAVALYKRACEGGEQWACSAIKKLGQ